MKQSLQIRLGHQITMTPHLQNAIRLLQLSNLELQTEIQQILDSNIMLEVAEDENETESEDDFSEQEALNDSNPDSSADTFNNESSESDEIVPDNILADDISNDLAVNSDWEEIYNNSTTPYDFTKNGETNQRDFAEQISISETLQDKLRWQLELSHFNEMECAIAIAIIDAIDSDGYLRSSLDDIAKSLGEDICVEVKKIKAVLNQIQHFEPLGVGARNLSECLSVQLSELEPDDTPWLKEAKRLVRKYLGLLGTHDYNQLCKRMKLERNDLQKVLKLIQSLNPRPGTKIETSYTNYVTPDVFVKKNHGLWKVELNSDISPKLRVNSYYAGLVSKFDGAENNTLKTHLQEARWFIKSLRSRQDTLLKVAKCIVWRQTGFLDYGEEAMKPLVLHDVAKELELHESTISRVTTQKYLHTPRGVFELKYFFSSHVSTQNGGECSSTAIRAMIRKIVAVENSAKPLSDNKIAEQLSERGIRVARRTVAKYREAMVIPPSNERKRFLE